MRYVVGSVQVSLVVFVVEILALSTYDLQGTLWVVQLQRRPANREGERAPLFHSLPYQRYTNYRHPKAITSLTLNSAFSFSATLPPRAWSPACTLSGWRLRSAVAFLPAGGRATPQRPFLPIRTLPSPVLCFSGDRDPIDAYYSRTPRVTPRQQSALVFHL